MDLKSFLIKEKERCDLTAIAFAKELYITPAYLSQIANGAIMPSYRLGCSIEEKTRGIVTYLHLLKFYQLHLKRKIGK